MSEDLITRQIVLQHTGKKYENTSSGYGNDDVGNLTSLSKLEIGEIAINNKPDVTKLYTKNDNGTLQDFEKGIITDIKLAKKIPLQVHKFRPTHSSLQTSLLKIHDSMYCCGDVNSMFKNKDILFEIPHDSIEVNVEFVSLISEKMDNPKIYYSTNSGEWDNRSFNDMVINGRILISDDIIHVYVGLDSDKYKCYILKNRGKVDNLEKIIVYSDTSRDCDLILDRWVHVLKNDSYYYGTHVIYGDYNYGVLNDKVIPYNDFVNNIIKINEDYNYEYEIYYRASGKGPYRWKRYMFNRFGEKHESSITKSPIQLLLKNNTYLGKAFKVEYDRFLTKRYIDFAIFKKNGINGKKVNKIGSIYRLNTIPIFEKNEEWNYSYQTSLKVDYNFYFISEINDLKGKDGIM